MAIRVTTARALLNTASSPTTGLVSQRQGSRFCLICTKEWSSPWKTNYAGLAHSTDGNTFTRLDVKWPNNDANSDPFQMWSMRRDGNWVYVFSVRSGRQFGPMMLQRVPWDRMTDQTAYEGWGWNGTDWAWGRPCSPILEGSFGEPSVRKLSDGTWAMVYLNFGLEFPTIVSRTAAGSDQEWSKEMVQVTWEREKSLYGGFIHPWSTSKENDLHLMVSKWTRDEAGHTTAYHMNQYIGTVQTSRWDDSVKEGGRGGRRRAGEMDSSPVTRTSATFLSCLY